MKYKYYSEEELKYILQREVKSLKEEYKESESDYVMGFLDRADFNVSKLIEQDLSDDALNLGELKFSGFINHLTEGRSDPAVNKYTNYSMLQKLYKEDIKTCEEECEKIKAEKINILRENNNRNDFNRNWFQKRFSWSRFSENKFHKEQWRKAHECDAKIEKMNYYIQKNHEQVAILDEKCRVFELRYEESNRAGGYTSNKSINDAVNKPVFNGGWGYTDANRERRMAEGLRQAQRNAWEDEIKTKGIIKHEKLNHNVLSDTNAKFDVKAYSRDEYNRNKAVQLQKKASLEKIKKDEISRKELVKTAYLKDQEKKEETKALYREIDKKEAVRTERFKSDYLKDQEKKEAKKETAMIFRIKLRMEDFLRTQRIKSTYVKDQIDKEHLRARGRIYKARATAIKDRTISYKAEEIKAKTTYLPNSKTTYKKYNEDRINGKNLYQLNKTMSLSYMREQASFAEEEAQRKIDEMQLNKTNLEQAKEKAEQLKEYSIEKAQQLKEFSKEKAQQLKETSFGLFNSFKKSATATFHKAVKSVSNTINQTSPPPLPPPPQNQETPTDQPTIQPTIK